MRKEAHDTKLRVSRVRIDPKVRLVRTASHSYTTQVVEVFTRDGPSAVRAKETPCPVSSASAVCYHAQP